MKYLKRFNEELKTSTYRSAAQKLRKKGFTKRADNLKKYANDLDWEKNINIYSKYGEYEIRVVNPKTKKEYIGKYYIDLSNIDRFGFEDQLEDFKEDNDGSFWIPIYIIPVDIETKKGLDDVTVDDMGSDGSYEALSFGINFTLNDNVFDIYEINFENYDKSLVGDVSITNRKDANKLRKLLIDLFTDKNLNYESGYEDSDDFFNGFWKVFGDDFGLNEYKGFDVSNFKNSLSKLISTNNMYK